LKLFFEAGTVSAADESIAAPRRAHGFSSLDPNLGKSGVAVASLRGGGCRDTGASVPVKPVTMEWAEWALSFQDEPVTIDYGAGAETTIDLLSSGVRLHPIPQADEERRNVDGTKRTL